jgi:hypothetical protein
VVLNWRTTTISSGAPALLIVARHSTPQLEKLAGPQRGILHPLTVLRSQVRVFAALGGVPREILYHRMKTAVIDGIIYNNSRLVTFRRNGHACRRLPNTTASFPKPVPRIDPRPIDLAGYRRPARAAHRSVIQLAL